MHLKNPFKRPVKKAYTQTKRLGHHVACSTHDILTDSFDDAQHSVGKLAKTVRRTVNDSVDDAIEHGLRQIHIMVEKRLEDLAAEIHGQVQYEINRRQSAITLIAIAVSLAVLSSIILSFGVVHLLMTLLDLPLWAACLIVGSSFAIVSGMLFVLGRQHFDQLDDEDHS